jgi:hypothetical protein
MTQYQEKLACLYMNSLKEKQKLPDQINIYWKHCSQGSAAGLDEIWSK